MPAYLIANVEILDAAQYETYKKLVPISIEKYGGRYLARGGRIDVLEGNLPLKRCMIVEFPSMERAREWWESGDYAPARALRHSTAKSDLVILDGI